MSYIKIKCNSCGNEINIDTSEKFVNCSHCGSTFSMQELLDESDLEFIEKLKPENVQKKIEVVSLIKKADALIFAARYEEAEAEYLKALELDDENYHIYYGLVKVYTKNLSQAPKNSNYKNYIKLALKFVPSDEYEYVKSELDKVKLLEKEEEKLKKQKLQQNKRNSKNEKLNQKIWGIATTIICIAVIAVAVLAIVIIVLKNNDDESKRAAGNSTIEITTAAELKTTLENKDYYSATIILKADIDFAGESWTPVGSASKAFSGKFYGNNHTIKKLKITDPASTGENYIGFFGYTKGAEIMGVKFEDIIITSVSDTSSATNYIGFVSGRADDTTIRQCEVAKNCAINVSNKTKGASNIGGIVGYAKNGTISNCLCKASLLVSASNVQILNSSPYAKNFSIGGIVGRAENLGLSNSYSSSDISADIKDTENNTLSLYASGIVGYAVGQSTANTYINNCFFTGSLTAYKDDDNVKIGAIVSDGIGQNQISKCAFLALDESFKYNDTSISANELSDNELSEIKPYDNSTTFIEDVTSNLNDEIWDNISTLEPTLKNPNTEDLSDIDTQSLSLKDVA